MTMTNNNRPPPLYPTPMRATCPVCGHTSYSSTGVHPQCSMHKADMERMQHVKRHTKERRTSASIAELSPWQKICPRCKLVAHVRKKDCSCGYKFPVGVRLAPK
jgi:hypothetical protein